MSTVERSVADGVGTISLNRPHRHNAVDDELQFHFDMTMRELMNAGMNPDDARREAERRFGDVVLPSEISVGWWFGTPRFRPFLISPLLGWTTCETATPWVKAMCSRSSSGLTV